MKKKVAVVSISNGVAHAGVRTVKVQNPWVSFEGKPINACQFDEDYQDESESADEIELTLAMERMANSPLPKITCGTVSERASLAHSRFRLFSKRNRGQKVMKKNRRRRQRPAPIIRDINEFVCEMHEDDRAEFERDQLMLEVEAMLITCRDHFLQLTLEIVLYELQTGSLPLAA